MKRLLPILALFALAAPAGAGDSHLVGQWTFSGADPLEAKIGTNAVEGVGRNPLVKTSTTNTLYAVTDPAVLGDRTGVLAVPIGSGILIPVPEGLTMTYCLSFDFFVPVYKQWVSLFSLDQNNNSDGYLFVRNGTDIGFSQYNTVGNVIGAWHQLVISMDAGTGTLWFDGTRLATPRSWDLYGKEYVLLAMDESGDDGLIYFDEVRFYDQARPAAVFADGANASVYATDRGDGTPSASVSSTYSRFGVLTVGVDVDDPGDDTCALEAVVETTDGRTLVRTLDAASAAGSFSFDLDDLGLAFGARGTVRVRATGAVRGRTATSAGRVFVFSTTGQPGSMTGLWTFARENPLEAKVGRDAFEGSGSRPLDRSTTTNALYAIADPSVLDGRTGVLAVPTGAGIVLPLPEGGVSNTWCFAFDFYVPEKKQWFAFFSINQDNSGDACLWMRNGTDVGSSQYDTVGDLVGSWHQLVVSMDAGTGTLYVDGSPLANRRNWNLAGCSWITLAIDNNGEDELMYFDEARFYDEARPADIFPVGTTAVVYLTDRDDGTPVLTLSSAGVSSDGLSLRLSGSILQSGDDACSLAALVSADGGAETSFPLAASAAAGDYSFSPSFTDLGLPEGASCTVRIVATGVSRGRSATTETKSFVVPAPGAAAFGENHEYGVTVQRVTASGSLERLGEGENTLLLVATGSDGVRRTLAAVPVSATGPFSVSGVFPGAGTIEAQLLCSNVVAGVSHVAALPSATLILGDDTTRYDRKASVPDAAWNDPAAWTASGLNVADAAGFPTEPTSAFFPGGCDIVTRIPAGTWKADMRFESTATTNLFAGEGIDSSTLVTPFWFWGAQDMLVVSNATWRTTDFGYRKADMTIRIDAGRWIANGAIEMINGNGPRPLLEVVNGGEVQLTTGLAVGATGTVVRVDGGSIRSPVELRIALSTASRLDVSIPETAPSAAPVQFSTITRANGNVTGTVVVNVPENRSKTPGNLPILSCPDGIPDGLVQLGSVPHPERSERLFFGYDGTDEETGTLRTGVWYRARPILPTLILFR